VGSRGLEEFGDGDALAADEEFGGWVVGFVEGGDAGQGLLAAATLDLDGDEGVAALEEVLGEGHGIVGSLAVRAQTGRRKCWVNAESKKLKAES